MGKVHGEEGGALHAGGDVDGGNDAGTRDVQRTGLGEGAHAIGTVLVSVPLQLKFSTSLDQVPDSNVVPSTQRISGFVAKHLDGKVMYDANKTNDPYDISNGFPLNGPPTASRLGEHLLTVVCPNLLDGTTDETVEVEVRTSDSVAFKVKRF